MSGPSIDGALLDGLETEFRERHFKRRRQSDYGQSEQAITAADLAEKHGIQDSEGSPKTREAIKILKRERGLPIVGTNNGFYIPLTEGPVEDYIETLEGRIHGIRENQELMRENWASWVAQVDGYEVEGEAEAEPDAEPGRKEHEAETDGGQSIPEDVREQTEEDPVLTVEDWLIHQGQGGDA